ncbi:MAG: glycosyltransferase family 4 protein [Kiritimatiellae bacterium]|jgi:glycosyltransferase involved in cell wall biosynthesis|nr:glycosyltransferase family 4 protein [Kiritimatiellia bacterium]HPC20076.1 glycosyltransferase family 4 protein [Kiritimatiellia bacterium]
MAFWQSQVWRDATTSICRKEESPDELCPCRQAFRLWRLRPRFDVVVTMGPRPSLAYGLLCALLRLPSKQVLTEVFLDEARPAAPLWRMKTALFRWIARRSLGVLTNSSGEVGLMARRFAIPESKLRFVPMYTTIERPAIREENDGSVVSIGRTLRDVDTLLAAARHIPAPIVIVAGARDRMPKDLPANVTVHRELPLEKTHELLAKAAVAVAPLQATERSTGQVFIFEAMAMGKPVVATRSIGTVDYIRDGENGLLVEPGDAQGLAAAVHRLLADPALAARLAAASWRDCQSELNADVHGQRKLKAINSLLNCVQ